MKFTKRTKSQIKIDIETKTKKCTKCKQTLSFDEFFDSKYSVDKKISMCKVCLPEYRKIKYKENPEIYREKSRRSHRKTRYGLSENDYEKVLKESNNKCKICKEETKLVIDHCHKSGKFRGLLCHPCNKMLGHARDNIKILKGAINYLKNA